MSLIEITLVQNFEYLFYFFILLYIYYLIINFSIINHDNFIDYCEIIKYNTDMRQKKVPFPKMGVIPGNENCMCIMMTWD